MLAICVALLTGCTPPNTTPAPIIYGQIERKLYVPPSSTTSFIVSGKGGVKPVFSSTPEQWIVLATINGKTESLHVDKSQYSRAEKGQRWRVEQSWGSYRLVDLDEEKGSVP